MQSPMACAFLLLSLALTLAQWPSLCQGRSTGVTGEGNWVDANSNATSAPSGCIAVWSRSSGDICNREVCLTHSGKTVLLSDIGDGHEQCKSIVERQLITVGDAGCPNGQVPGPPTKLEVSVITDDYHVGFHIVLTWSQPMDPTNLIGFRIEITLKTGSVLESFYLPKAATEYPNTPGLHSARIMANSTLCKRCVVSRMLVLGQLIDSLDEHEKLIKVTSLPLPDDGIDTGMYEVHLLSIPSCEAMHCLPSMRFALPIADPSCPFARSPGRKHAKRLCTCPFGDHIYNTTISVTGISSNKTNVTVQWQWLKASTSDEAVIRSLFINIKRGGGGELRYSDTMEFDVTKPTHFAAHTFELDFPVQHGDVLVAMGELSEEYDYRQLELRKFVYFCPTPEPPRPITSAGTLPHVSKYVLLPVTTEESLSLVLGAVGAYVSVLVFVGVVVLVFWNVGPRKCTKPEMGSSGQRTTSAAISHTAARCPPLPNDCQHQIYLSYSRFTESTRTMAWRLWQDLTASGINTVLPEHHLDAMEDIGRESWIEEQISKSTFVLVLLDNTYPMNLTDLARQELVRAGCPGNILHVLIECTLLEGEMYSGRSNFVVPVFIGPAEQARASIPPVLRDKTAYRLPIDFDATSADFGRLRRRIAEQPRHLRHMLTRI